MDQDDLDGLRQWFADYCRSFREGGDEDPHPYAVKEEHTRRVVADALRLAGSLGLDPGRTARSATVALFHDLGRFPQYRHYRTFRDSVSVNHAALSAQVLREQKALGHLPEEDRTSILRAITLHNVFALPRGLDPETLLLAKLIRDADKLDIWRIFVEQSQLPDSERSDVVALGLPDTPVCSPQALERLAEGRMVEHTMISNQNDFKLLQLSWVYDLNVPESFRLLKERGHVDSLARTLPRDDRVRRAVEDVKRYVEKKAEKQVRREK